MKVSKGILVAVVVFLALGAVFCFAGFATGGFSMEGINNQSPLEKRTYTAEVEVSEIILSEKLVNNVVLTASEEEHIVVNYMQNETRQYTIECSENGVLSISKQLNLKWFQHIFNWGFGYDKSVIEIKIPQGMIQKLTIHASNSQLAIKNITVGADLDVSVDNGSVIAQNVEVLGNAKFDADNGKITIIEGTYKGSLTCGTANGAVSVKDVVAKIANIQAANGRVEVNGSKIESLMAKSNNGRIGIEMSTVGVLTATTNNGAIAFDLLTITAKADFNTANGSIKGSIIGAKAQFNLVVAKSSSSNINTEDNHAAKSLHFKALNGTIMVEFVA